MNGIISNSSSSSANSNQRPIPYVKIIYQPSSVYRMRYKAEKRTTFLYAENDSLTNDSKPCTSSTSLNNNVKKPNLPKRKPNIQSEPNEGTFPRIQIVNGSGPATLIVSCVNKCEPYHVHPHRLVGLSCKSGVAVLNIQKGETHFDLAGISIEFTKKSDIEESLIELRNKNVDPFNVGFNFDRNNIDLTQLRLCFQVYLRDSLDTNEIIRDQYHILKPIVSNIICNTSRKTSLTITKANHLHSQASGGEEVILFFKKLEKDQKPLYVKFFDDSGWSKEEKLNDSNLHFQCAAYFKAPMYKNTDIEKDVIVNLKLYVPFSNDHEKAEFIKTQINEDKDDDEDSMDSGINSTDLYSGGIPDGKYESKVLEFVYRPIYLSQTKRKLDVNGFYDYSDQNERDASSEINPQVRKKLSVRLTDSLPISNLVTQIDENSFIQLDPPLLNNLMAYSNETNQNTDMNNNSVLITNKNNNNVINNNNINNVYNSNESQICLNDFTSILQEDNLPLDNLLFTSLSLDYENNSQINSNDVNFDQIFQHLCS